MTSEAESNLLLLSNLLLKGRFRFGFWVGAAILIVFAGVGLGRTDWLFGEAEAASLYSSTEVCQTFDQVNDSAFGLGPGADGKYASEEGFEVIVFNNQLYVGMEADNSFGARIWRTRAGISAPSSQADWEEVAADPDGHPFGVTELAQVDHIDSLAEFNGYLYASAANGGTNTLGTRVFRSLTGNPGTWADAISQLGPGFGDTNNQNFKDMQVFQGWLCGGTQNWLKGAQVWCTSDGTSWVQKNVSGFGNQYSDSSNLKIWSGYVFDSALYFGVQNVGASYSDATDDVARLFRTSDLDGSPEWTEVYSGDPGSYRVDILGELDNGLYISVQSANGIIVLRSPNGGSNSWVRVNSPGMGASSQNSGTLVDGAEIHENALYLGVSNKTSGFELWRSTGAAQDGAGQVDWQLVADNGLGDANNVLSQLIAYNDYLYTWTSNYASGQQVLRSGCSLDNLGGSTPTPTAVSTSDPTPETTPTPDSLQTPAGPTPTPTDAPTGSPSATPTETPQPTVYCPSDASYCQEPNAGFVNNAIFLPLAIKVMP